MLKIFSHCSLCFVSCLGLNLFHTRKYLSEKEVQFESFITVALVAVYNLSLEFVEFG